MEKWIDIKDCPGYQVSSFGRVKSTRCKNTIIVKNHDNGKGYLILRIYNRERVRCNIKVHRLVAIHFIPNPENKKQVNHINGNKYDNRASNLDWCTSFENMQHASRLGLFPNRKGSMHPNSTLNEDKVEKIIYLLKMGRSQKSIADLFRVDPSLISLIKRNKAWVHVARD